MLMSNNNSNTCEDVGKKTIRINEDDQDNIEAAGYDLGTSSSTLFHELAEDAALLAEIQDMKKSEIRELREKARDLESQFNIK